MLGISYRGNIILVYLPCMTDRLCSNTFKLGFKKSNFKISNCMKVWFVSSKESLTFSGWSSPLSYSLHSLLSLLWTASKDWAMTNYWGGSRYSVKRNWEAVEKKRDEFAQAVDGGGLGEESSGARPDSSQSEVSHHVPSMSNISYQYICHYGQRC